MVLGEPIEMMQSSCVVEGEKVPAEIKGKIMFNDKTSRRLINQSAGSVNKTFVVR